MRFSLNGRRVEVQAPPLERLLDVLRERCGLTGTKEGCGEGECGACTVLIDGAPVASCLVPVAHAEGRRVVTIEGVPSDHPLKRRFAEEGAAQCGICTPGMILAAMAIPRGATLPVIQEALAGNLCRCTGYTAIYRAVQKAVAPARPPAAAAATRAGPRRKGKASVGKRPRAGKPKIRPTPADRRGDRGRRSS
jgi:aerobic carbon-monoxide dehydrogenase small subunit